MKHLGIDFGTKRIGLATSDDSGSIAFPREVITNNDKVLNHILDVCEQEGIGAVVIGHSQTAGGVDNAVMKYINDFVAQFSLVSGLPVHMMNEYGSSGAVYSAMDFVAGKPRNQDRKTKKDTTPIDDKAAAVILQRYLDKK